MGARSEALANAARVISVGLELAALKSPRQAAEDAHYAGGPSVDELEQRIEKERHKARLRTAA